MTTQAREIYRRPDEPIYFDLYRTKSRIFYGQVMRQMIFRRAALFANGIRIAVIASFAGMVLIGLAAAIHVAAEEIGPRQGFSSFGPEQVIADASRLEWAPLKLEGLAPGAEIVVLRGDLSKGPSELLLRIPAHFVVPNHSHSSDETYVWLKGRLGGWCWGRNSPRGLGHDRHRRDDSHHAGDTCNSQTEHHGSSPATPRNSRIRW